jgi:hypothetical protein
LLFGAIADRFDVAQIGDQLWRQPRDETAEMQWAAVDKPASRQLVLAPCALPLFGFELCHAEQVDEYPQPMAFGELHKFGNSLRDEGHGLVRAALLASFADTFAGWRVPMFA